LAFKVAKLFFSIFFHFSISSKKVTHNPSQQKMAHHPTENNIVAHQRLAVIKKAKRALAHMNL
jgi:hypothetical protein